MNKDFNIFDYFSYFIYGFLESFQVEWESKPLDYYLFSIKDNLRLGCRFFSRGADKESNVSNYVRIESFLIFPLDISIQKFKIYSLV